jgi:hypothetical protein
MKKNNKLNETTNEIKQKKKDYYLKNRTKIINNATSHYYKNLTDHISKRGNDIEVKRNVTFFI